MSKKILVTGGTGYIGSHTVVELINAGHEVEIVDNLYNSKISVLDKIEEITGVRPKFYEADLLDFSTLMDIFQDGEYDAVMHFAGLKAVAESVREPLLYYDNNLYGTLNVLKCMRICGVHELVFSSSATVYGAINSGKLTEEMETGREITNPYGETKYIIERIISDLAASWPKFSAVILRYFNPVGAHPSGLIGEDPNGIPNNLMPVIMNVYRGEIAELSIYGDDYETADGTCVRDYIHVVDLAKGHIAALNALDKRGVLVYNLGTGKGTSVKEMVAAFEKASGEKLPCRVAERRAGDIAEMYASPEKAEKELRWKAELTIDDAMRDTLKYIKNT